MHILIADDDPVYQKLLEDLLQGWGYDPIITRDGVEAWEVLDKPDAPSLLLLDWVMPRMDGYELCRKFRQRDAGRSAYIIMLTGSRQKREIMKTLVAGADDYLIKPFDPMDLQIHLRSAQRILSLQAELAELGGMPQVRSA